MLHSLRWFILSMLGLGLITGGLWYTQQFILKDLPNIQQVKIKGNYSHLSQQELIDAALPYVQANFFQIDLKALRQCLLAFPWVDKVAVSRIWPDMVVITIAEQQAVAVWGKTNLLNLRGEIFSPNPFDPKAWVALPHLIGPSDRSYQVYQQYQAWNKVLRELDVAITVLHLDARGGWSLRLSNGMKVILGQDDPEQRLKRFFKLYPKVFAAGAGDVIRVDLRYTNGFAVKWRETSVAT